MSENGQTRLAYDARATIGEGPLWRAGSLWWSDPVERKLLRGSGDSFEGVVVQRSIWSLAALPDGQMVGSLDDRFAGVGDHGILTVAPAADVAPGCRFNDMTAGRDGTLWVGTMHRGILASRGAIFRADSIEARPRQVADGLGAPNGMELSRDGRTLFVVDTLQRTLLAYPVCGEGLGQPVIVTDFLGLPGKPDGMTLAPDGAFWVAMWGGCCIVEIAPDGATLRQIAVPAPHVSSLCFAPSGRLLVTTSRMRLGPQMLELHPHSGGVFEVLSEDAA